MRVMERELFTDHNGKTAEIMRQTRGYTVTIWEGWSISSRKLFSTYESAKNHLDRDHFVKRNY